MTRTASLICLLVALAGCSATTDGAAAPSSPTPSATAVPSTTITAIRSAVPSPTSGSTAGSSVDSSSTPPSTSAPPTSTPPSTTASLPSVGISGVNDPECRSSLPPVVLLHGTFSTPLSNFNRLAPALQAAGRCVYAVLYGAAFGYGGIGDIDASAAAVETFLDRVRAATGAPLLDVVAFSQGALVLRDALQRALTSGSGAAPGGVALAIFLAPNYHGTTIALASKVPAALCPACGEQAAGSALLQRLAAGGELTSGVRYASLLLDDDAWVQPLSTQGPQGSPSLVRTQILQDACPRVDVEHSVLPLAPPAIAWTLDALATGARPSTSLSCG